MLTKMHVLAGCAVAVLALPAQADERVLAAAPVPVVKAADLKAPEITKLFTQQQIAAVLARTLDPDLERVEVEGSRIHAPIPNTPTVWPAIAAPVWAILHPTQAWRIIAPLPPDQAQDIPVDTASTAVAIPLTARSIPKIGEQ